MHLHELKIGDRVEVSPAHDMWMRGARFGTVKKIGRKYAHINMDYRYDKESTMQFVPENIARKVDIGNRLEENAKRLGPYLGAE